MGEQKLENRDGFRQITSAETNSNFHQFQECPDYSQLWPEQDKNGITEAPPSIFEEGANDKHTIEGGVRSKFLGKKFPEC